MDFVFTGSPTKREIIIYLSNRRYSLLNNTKLKRQIIRYNKIIERKKDKMILQSINFLWKVSNTLHDIKLSKENYFTDLKFNIFYRGMKMKEILSNCHTEDLVRYFTEYLIKDRPFEIKEMSHQHETVVKHDKDFKNKIAQNKIMGTKKGFDFFDENSDDGSFQRDKLDVSVLVSPIKINDSKVFDRNIISKINLGTDNLKRISENSSTKQRKIDLDEFTMKDTEENKKIDFTFTKIANKKNKLVLQEIDRNTTKKIKKPVVEDYAKILSKNTRLNSGYKNVIVKYTEKLITNNIKIDRIRNQKVKFVDTEEADVHNLHSPVPIIKKSKFHNKTSFQSKHKEVVFIQNVDLYSFENDNDF
jgi:hypothetical protein